MSTKYRPPSVLLLTALSALSCVAADAQEFDFPALQLESTSGPAAAAARPAVRVQFRLDDEDWTVAVDGGGAAGTIAADANVDVTIDGEPAPDGRVGRNGVLLSLKDPYGSAVAQVVLVGGDSLQVRFLPRSTKPYLGIDLQPVADALAAHLDLDPDVAGQVVLVAPESPAERGELVVHDILLSIDGEDGGTAEDLGRVLDAKRPGQTVTLGLLRGGRRLDLDVELGRARSAASLYTPLLDLGAAETDLAWPYLIASGAFADSNVVSESSWPTLLYQAHARSLFQNRTPWSPGDEGVVDRLSRSADQLESSTDAVDAFRNAVEQFENGSKSANERLGKQIERLQERIDALERLLKARSGSRGAGR